MPDRLSFKEMCARFDVTPRTLRYYEYIELLQPEREGRARWYGPKECARMTLILRGRKFGFQLEDIGQWLLIYEKAGGRGHGRAQTPARRNRRFAEKVTALQGGFPRRSSRFDRLKNFLPNNKISFRPR